MYGEEASQSRRVTNRFEPNPSCALGLRGATGAVEGGL